MEINLRADGTMAWTFQDKTESPIEGKWKLDGDKVFITPENPMVQSFWKRMFPSSTTDADLVLTYDPGEDVLKLPAPLHSKETGPWTFTRK